MSPATPKQTDPVPETHGQRSTRFDHAVLPYLDWLYAAGVPMTGNQANAEDLVRETFATADASLHQLQQGASLRDWLFQILSNTLLNTDRKQQPESQRSGTEDITAPDPGHAPGAGTRRPFRPQHAQREPMQAGDPAAALCSCVEPGQDLPADVPDSRAPTAAGRMTSSARPARTTAAI